jgi:hypothetical protein
MIEPIVACLAKRFRTGALAGVPACGHVRVRDWCRPSRARGVRAPGTWRTPLLAALSLFGCNSAGNGGDGLTTSATQASTTSGGGEEHSATHGDTSNASTTDGDACKASVSGPEVRLRVTNGSAATVYLFAPGCLATEVFDIYSPSGRIPWPSPACATTCAEALATACEGGQCTDGCHGPAVARLEPGATLEQVWDGTQYINYHWEAAAGPDACFDAVCDEVDCQMPSLVAEGPFEVRAEIWTQCIAISPGNCDCAPNDDGWCVGTADAEMNGEKTVLSQQFTYPIDGVVELNYE